MKYRSAVRWLRRGKAFLISSFFCLGLLVVSVASRPSIAQPPPSLDACIPQPLVVQTEQIGSTQIEGETYYLLIAYEEVDERGSDLIISITNGQCELKFWNPMGDPIPFADSIPLPAARQLTLASYQHAIEKVGREAFDESVAEAIEQGAAEFLLEEEKWALRQLGFEIPE